MKRFPVFLLLFLMLCGCSSQTPASAVPTEQVSASEITVSEIAVSAVPEASTEEAPSHPETEPDASVQAEEATSPAAEVLGQVAYDEHHFVTEREFYRVMTEALEAYSLKMTPCTDGSADFYFDYGNISEVKLLTLSADAEQVAEDIADAASQHSLKEEALQRDSLSEAQYRGLSRNTQYNPDRDPMESDQLVTACIIHASAAADDQTLFYMVSSIAYSILHPDFQEDTAAFDALKLNLFQLYAGNTSDTDYVSWIHGISTREKDASLTIPGNGIECWFGTKEDRSLWLDITPYVYYEELIDVATAIG